MLAAARNGDEKAFMAMVSPLAHGLQRLANRYSRNSADADDICQESLLKAYLKLEQFSCAQEPATHEFHSWLMKIAANSAIDFIRRKHTNRFVPLDESNHVHNKSHEAGTGGWGENPERAYVRRQQRGLMVEAIASLPAELRRVCLLRDVMEFSTQEVATKLGISATAVRLRLFRAHGRLRKSLGAAATCFGPRRNGNEFAKLRNSTRAQNPRKQHRARILLPYSAKENCAYGD